MSVAAHSSVMDTSLDAAASASAAQKPTAAVAPQSTRPDGRLATELRPISVEHGLLNRADGSVQWTQGGTSVLVGVYGPVMVGGKDEKIDRATVTVNFKAASGQANNLDIERGSYIRQCFEPLLLLSVAPRSKIQIQVQVLRDSGSVLSCALNAVSLALLDAGIQATAVLSAACVAAAPIDQANGTGQAAKDAGDASASAAFAAAGAHSYLLDPLSSEEDVSPTLTLAFASTGPGTILSLVERGSFQQHTYNDATLIGRAACAHVLHFMKISLERKQNGTL